MKILTICGSTRKGSYNRKLLNLAEAAIQSGGHEIVPVDFAALAIPFYNGDLEAQSGPPEGALKLHGLIIAADGIVIVSPEYNYSIPALLKNAIDWVSRITKPLAFRGKVAAILGASPGMSGTARMQPQLRTVLASQGAWVLPGTVMLPYADKAFAEDGSLTDERAALDLSRVVGEFLTACEKLTER